MKKICISAVEKSFFNYGFNMFSSFKHFHPNIKCICCDFGLENYQKRFLKKLDVEVIKVDYKLKNLRCSDMIIYEFIKNKNWDKILWIDADTILLSSIDEVFQNTEEFVAVPGRNKNGLIHYTKDFLGYEESDNFLYYSTGFWVTSSKKLLYDFSEYLKKNPNTTFDCVPVTKIVNQYYTHKHLDGNIYNFGRDLIPMAQLKNNEIFYKMNDEIIYPKLVHFSSCDDGKRLESDIIKIFFERNIQVKWQIKML